MADDLTYVDILAHTSLICCHKHGKCTTKTENIFDVFLTQHVNVTKINVYQS